MGAGICISTVYLIRVVVSCDGARESDVSCVGGFGEMCEMGIREGEQKHTRMIEVCVDGER